MQDPQKQQEEAEEWVVEYTAEILSGHLPGKSATGAFSGQGVGYPKLSKWKFMATRQRMRKQKQVYLPVCNCI